MINTYIHYIITSDGRLYCDYFKGKKVNSFKCKIDSDLVKHSLNSPLTSKNNFIKVSSRSFSTTSKPQESSICSTNATDLLNLSPGWVTGFSDGECSFHVVVRKDNTYKSGWTIIPAYKIELHKRDLDVLIAIQKFFGGIGKIQHLSEKGHVAYSVNSIKDLHEVIVPHFEKYPLLTVKRLAFMLFRQIIELLVNKQHLNSEGLLKILGFRTLMNKGVSDELLSSFNSFSIQVTGKPLSVSNPTLTPLSLKDISKDWLIGFTDAEGCFYISFRANRKKDGYWAGLVFTIAQHSRDLLLFQLIKEFLGVGNIVQEKAKDVVRFRTDNFLQIYENIIPFFSNNALKSSKSQNYLDFCKASELIKSKSHLTEKGANEIRLIKSGMNSKRI